MSKQREILFRGKQEYNGEWAESWCPNGSMLAGTVIHDFKSETVGQYTGLTDKNGKRIFEGDVVRYLGSDGKNYYGDIYYKDGAWWIKLRSCFGSAVILMDLYEKVEVVGNVHDNPELLKGGLNNDNSKRNQR